MKSSLLNGSRQQAGAQKPSANVLSANTRRPRSSASKPCSDHNVVSLAAYKARKRRALAAKANASRRAVIAVTLCLLGMTASVLVMDRETQAPAVYSATR